MLILEVPRDQVLLFDMRVWNKMLNLSYVGKSSEDEEEFEQRMARTGVPDTVSVFSTPFYPLFKREIIKSWDYLFSSADECSESYHQAGIWELKKEWIVDKRIL